MAYLNTLRLNFPEGRRNEYRLNEEGELQFCGSNGRWRALSESDVQLHLNLGTEVAHWLRSRWVERNPFLLNQN